jgi:hypothetical protein
LLTGTDVYHDIHHSPEARESLELADRLIVLQPKAAESSPPAEFARRGAKPTTHIRHQPIKNNFRP